MDNTTIESLRALWEANSELKAGLYSNMSMITRAYNNMSESVNNISAGQDYMTYAIIGLTVLCLTLLFALYFLSKSLDKRFKLNEHVISAIAKANPKVLKALNDEKL